MKVFHGDIITCDAKNTVMSYLVEKDGRIAYVGDDLPAAFSGLDVVEIEGAIIPAFNDAYIHYSSFATMYQGLNLYDVNSNHEILDKLNSYAQANNDSTIIGYGVPCNDIAGELVVHKKQLDAVCPNRPVCLINYDGHVCIVNTALIDQYRSKISILRGFNDENGLMSQEAYAVILEGIVRVNSTRKIIGKMIDTADLLAKNGVGFIYSSSGMGFVRDVDVDMENSVAQGFDNGIQMRVAFRTDDISKVVKKNMHRIVSKPLDGTFSSKDAALLEPYSNDSLNKGNLYIKDEDIKAFCIESNRKGLQIVIHAFGDAAFKQATEAIRAALEDYPRYEHRHMIVHACLPTDEGLEICQKYNIILCVQPGFIYWNKEPQAYLETIIGNRYYGLNPIKKLYNMGIRVCFGSDAPATIPEPMTWVHNVCNNTNPVNSIDAYNAIKMATYNGAVAAFEENERGSLEIGKTADMVILDKNPLTVPIDQIKNVGVNQLYIAGEEYRHSRANAMTTMLRGMFPQ